MHRRHDLTSAESESRRQRAEATAEGKVSREERCYLRTRRMADEWPRGARGRREERTEESIMK